MSKNERGFGLTGVLLIIIVILLVGFAGWYVWKKRSDPAKSEVSSSSSSGGKKEDSGAKDEVDPTIDWVTFTSEAGKYSFKHPKSWVLAANAELCNEGLTLIAANAASVGTCASESFGQIGIGSNEGDRRGDYTFSTGYIDVTEAGAMANGVLGTRTTAIASGQEAGEGPGAYPDGTKFVRYVFYTNNHTYTATYVQGATYPDSLADFDVLVTKTLVFIK